ncbi:hypothetical protein D3C83_253690 [compost metagenome]
MDAACQPQLFNHRRPQRIGKNRDSFSHALGFPNVDEPALEVEILATKPKRL